MYYAFRVTSALPDESGPAVPQGPATVPAYLGLDPSRVALLWAWFGRPAYGERERSDPINDDPDGMLQKFARIADANGVLRFARKYGVLQLCGHWLPAMHASPGAPWTVPTEQAIPCGPFSSPEFSMGRQPVNCEPIAVWRSFARRVAAYLRLVVAARRDELGAAADWDTFIEDWPSQMEGDPFDYGTALRNPAAASWDLLSDARSRNPKGDAEHWRPASLWAARGRLAWEVSQWLTLGGAAPRMIWTDETPTFRLMGGTFATIALQMLQASVGDWRLPVLCFACGQSFTPRRKRVFGKPSFCTREKCRRAANKLRQRRHREKQAKQQEDER